MRRPSQDSTATEIEMVCPAPKRRVAGRLLARALAAILLVTATGCVPQASLFGARSGSSFLGVYLQPLPPRFRDLRVEVTGVSAVAVDGCSYPLNLYLREVRAEGDARQCLFADGFLPPGDYRGLAVAIGGAWRLGEEGEGALVVPEEPVPVPVPFHLEPDRGELVRLEFDPGLAAVEGFRLTAAFRPLLRETVLPAVAGYVTGPAGNLVTTFNTLDLEATAALGSGPAPLALAIDRQRHRAYVALAADAVQVFDLAQYRSLFTISLRAGDNPLDLALSPDGRLLVTVNAGSNTVSLIDTVSLMETGRLTVGQRPIAALFAPEGDRVFVASELSQSLAVVEPAGPRILARLPLPTAPGRLALSSDDRQLFVAGRMPTLTVLDLSDLTVTGRLDLGAAAFALQTDRASGLLYLGLQRFGEVVVIDPSTLMPLDSLVLGGPAERLVIDGANNALLATIPSLSRVERFTLAGMRRTEVLEAAGGVRGLALWEEQ